MRMFLYNHSVLAERQIVEWLFTSVGYLGVLSVAVTRSSRSKPFVCLFVCLLQDASGHSNVLKAGKAEELKNARKRRTARKAN